MEVVDEGLAEFHDRARPVSIGRFEFSVDKAALREATGSVRICAGATPEGSLPVRLSLLPTGRIKLAAFGASAFAEALAASPEIPETFPPFGISLVLDLTVLARVASSFSSGQISFDYDAARMLLTVRQQGSKIELPTLPDTLFATYRIKLGELRFVKRLPFGLFRHVLDSASLFTREGAGMEGLSVVSIQEMTIPGRMVDGRHVHRSTTVGAGGSMTATTAIQAAGLNGLTVHLHQASLAVLNKMQTRFDAEQVDLFETDSHYVLRDPKTSLGLEKAVRGFPVKGPRAYLSVQPEQIVQVGRSAMVETLARLSCIGVTPSTLLEIGVMPQTEGGDRLALRITDPSGRVSEDTLPAARHVTPGSKPKSSYLAAAVSLTEITKAVRHSEGDLNLTFAPSALVMYDRGEGWVATTILQSVPASVSKMRAAYGT